MPRDLVERRMAAVTIIRTMVLLGFFVVNYQPNFVANNILIVSEIHYFAPGPVAIGIIFEIAVGSDTLLPIFDFVNLR